MIPTLRQILAENQIIISKNKKLVYSYDWTSCENEHLKFFGKLDSFLENLLKRLDGSKYRLGIFSMKKISNNQLCLLLGRKQFITVIILIVTLFKLIMDRKGVLSEDKFPDELYQIYKETIKNNGVYRIVFPNELEGFFNDCIINRIKDKPPEFSDKWVGDSVEKTFAAFNYFQKSLNKYDENTLIKILNIVTNAECHINYEID